MAIKNYTTEVEVYKSLGEIQGALAGHGARKVMVDYTAAGQPTGIMFAIETPAGPRGFCLPANIDGVRTAQLLPAGVRGKPGLGLGTGDNVWGKRKVTPSRDFIWKISSSNISPASATGKTA